MLAIYCNVITSARLISTEESLFIEFVSDSKKERTGFAANYSFISTLQATSPDDIIISSPIVVYPSKKYVIKDGRGLIIIIIIYEFLFDT